MHQAALVIVARSEQVIVRGFCAHSPWEIHKEQLYWNHGYLECLSSSSCGTRVVDLACDAN
jgi:hypothetical protein